VTHE